jgi:acyl-CoA synthetase (AMP-forming)/AMP-acid ligase II
MVLRDNQTFTLAEMIAFLKDRRLPMYKVPEQLEIVPALPRNPTGKVLKKDLRATYGGSA